MSKKTIATGIFVYLLVVSVLAGVVFLNNSYKTGENLSPTVTPLPTVVPVAEAENYQGSAWKMVGYVNGVPFEGNLWTNEELAAAAKMGSEWETRVTHVPTGKTWTLPILLGTSVRETSTYYTQALAGPVYTGPDSYKWETHYLRVDGIHLVGPSPRSHFIEWSDEYVYALDLDNIDEDGNYPIVQFEESKN